MIVAERIVSTCLFDTGILRGNVGARVLFKAEIGIFNNNNPGYCSL